MAFDGLSSRLQMALRRMTGRGSLTEKDMLFCNNSFINK